MVPPLISSPATTTNDSLSYHYKWKDSELSLFDHFSAQQIKSEPFPHINAPNVLDKKLVEELISARPSLESIIAGTDAYPARKYHYHSANALQSEILAPIWKDMVQEHLKEVELRKFLSVFAEPIAEEYPELIKRYGDPQSWSIGQRYLDKPEDHVLLADAQFTYHMPVPGEPTQERGPHIKIPNKLIVVIFLLRLPEDKDAGGEIEIYQAVDGQSVAYGKDTAIMTPDAVKLYDVVPYEANRAFCFLNSPRTITTFSKRGHNEIPQMYFNVIMEFPHPIFELSQRFGRKQGFVDRVSQGVKKIFSFS
jgi:hypothetical protein